MWAVAPAQIWQIPDFAIFGRNFGKFGDFGHLKKWPKMGSKRSKTGPNFEFLTVLVTLGKF